MSKRDRKKRPTGLLGMPLLADSDDEDYRPPSSLRSPDSSQPAKQQSRSKRVRLSTQSSSSAAARQEAQAMHSDDDVPLAERLARHAEAGPSSQARAQLSPKDASWANLPQDLLGMIFAHLCKRGSVPSAAAVSSVCSSWRAAALARPELWKVLDLSSCLKTPPYQLLTARGRWSQVQEVILSDWPADGPPLVAALADRCPQVHSFTLTSARLKEADISPAWHRWPLLSSLTLQHVTCRPRLAPLVAPLITDPPPPGALAGPPDAAAGPAPPEPVAADAGGALGGGGGAPPPAPAAPSTAAPAAGGAEQGGAGGAGGLEQQRRQLKRLVLRSCTGVDNLLIKALCPPITRAVPRGEGALGALRELDLSHSGNLCDSSLSISIERLQHAAPLLEVLKLTGLGKMFGCRMPVLRRQEAEIAGAVGFPALRCCWLGSYASPDAATKLRTFNRGWVGDNELLRICGRSPLLEELELTGTRVSASSLLQLPARLQTLLISESPLCSDEGFAAIAERYSSTVEEVQAAGGGDSLSGVGVAAMGGCGRLKALDASSSTVDEAGLRLLLGGPAGDSLQHLDIASCRSVPRHLRTAVHVRGVPGLKQAMGL